MTEEKTAIINTERLCLRAIADKDVDGVIEILTNDEVCKTFMVPVFTSHEEELKLFESLKYRSGLSGRFVYGIYLDDNIIGFINDVGIDGDEIELGYVVHPVQHNKGFATEVLSASIKELFRLGYSVVKAGAFEENIASIRVMEKSGMVPTGREEPVEYNGKTHRCIYYEKRKVSDEQM